MLIILTTILDFILSNPFVQTILLVGTGWLGLKIKDRKIDKLKDNLIKERIENATNDEIARSLAAKRDYERMLSERGVKEHIVKDRYNRDNSS